MTRVGYIAAILIVLCCFSCKKQETSINDNQIEWRQTFTDFVLKKRGYTKAIDSVSGVLLDQKISKQVKLEALADMATRFNCDNNKIFQEELDYQSKLIDYERGRFLVMYLRQRCIAEQGMLDSVNYFHSNFSYFLKNDTALNILSVLNIATGYVSLDKFSIADSVIKKIIPLAKLYGDNYLLTRVYYELAECNRKNFKNSDALKYQEISIDYARKCNEPYFIATGYVNMCEALLIEANYLKALEYLNQALIYSFKGKERFLEAHILGTIGEIYRLREEYDKAIPYLHKSIKVSRATNYKYQEAYSSTTLGEVYKAKKNYERALNYLRLAVNIDSTKKYLDDEMYAKSCIGSVYLELGELKLAEKYFMEVKSRENDLYDNSVVADVYLHLGTIRLKEKKLKEAEEFTQRAVRISKESGIMVPLIEGYELFYKIAEAKNDSKSALSWLKLNVELKDSVEKNDKVKKFTDLEYNLKVNQMSITQAKKEAAFAIEKAKRESELKKQRVLSYSIGFGFLGLFVFSVIIYRSLQDNKRKNVIISDQKREVERQKEIIEVKKKEVVDSIEYAKKIQEAILPSFEAIQNCFPESFVLFNPKDIVAGDFYWMETTHDSVLIAAADCTGHGVPGAMVSVVCSNALNRAVKEFNLNDPGAILDKVRDIVIDTFQKSGSEVKDGMDISLVSIPKSRSGGEVKIKWAGANNPLWYMSKNIITEVKPNKQPVGKFVKQDPFTTNEISLTKGSKLYLITDGFADQFGGPKGKKFKYKSLKHEISNLNGTNMKTQGENLQALFNSWKSSLEQVDDVTIIGIMI